VSSNSMCAYLSNHLVQSADRHAIIAALRMLVHSHL